MIPVRAYLAIAGVIAIIGGVWWFSHARYTAGYDAGKEEIQSEWDAAIAAANTATVERQAERAEVTTKVETVYVDRVKTIRGKTIETIREVPVYVQADSCSLSGGFRLFHDWASLPSGPRPDPADQSDAAAVPAQTLAGTIAENYGVCHENAERLRALQEWVKGQGALQ